MKKIVVFIFSSPDGRDLSPLGTGFLVGVPLPQNRQRMKVYLVTARHVLEDENGNLHDRVWVRLNLL